MVVLRCGGSPPRQRIAGNGCWKDSIRAKAPCPATGSPVGFFDRGRDEHAGLAAATEPSMVERRASVLASGSVGFAHLHFSDASRMIGPRK